MKAKTSVQSLIACMICAVSLAACADKPPNKTTNAQNSDSSAPQRIIAPTDFVIAPCDLSIGTPDCAIIAAGGKRVLVGAPAGIGEGKIKGDTIPPDAVILTSLHAAAIEGLDEVRNRAWTSGRRTPLGVAGPDGTTQLVNALNEAYVTSDALAYIEGDRQGRFNQVAITAKEISPGEIAFDTGDLTISALNGGGARLAFLLTYNGQRVILAACGATATETADWPEAETYIGCSQNDLQLPGRGTWPLQEPIHLNK